ncbi:MAG: CinA family protein [Chlamydiae bacterium]|nr:CinA family protein [Chlamydiota bacterium]
MKSYSVSLAESMTGGLVSAKMVEIPDASDYFFGGVVAYSDRSKVELLFVKEESLENYGAISSEVAIEMARGVKKRFHTDLALSVTGYAGPKGRDVGLVYVGIIFKDHEDCKKLQIRGKSRTEIINETTEWMIRQIEFLRKAP